jgi:hypothetical protein
LTISSSAKTAEEKFFITLDIDLEVKKWKIEFGEQEGAKN